MPIPTVAIIGRANVGKSTLFNKICKKRSSIVNDTPGVTRDRVYGKAEWFGKSFMLADTGGIDLDGDGEVEVQVREQADFALEEAEIIIFVVDGRQGLTPQDKEVVEKIRRSGKPLFLAVNKIDDPRMEDLALEFHQLGIENTFPVSAEHGHGISFLLEAVAEQIPGSLPAEEVPKGIKVAVIGKPNVGKSTLINQLLHSNRCIVSATPGTTRDTVDIPLEVDGKQYDLIDTAGIRRKGKTRKLLDKFSVIMALKALERCDIAVLMIDAVDGVSDQDAVIAGYAFDKGAGCIIAANKWDLVDPEETSKSSFEEIIRTKLRFLEFAPIITLSAKTGMGVEKFFPEVDRVYKEYSKRVSTASLNECFMKAIEKNPMSGYRGKFLKLFYATQVKNCPPTFKCFINYPEGVHFSYRRYLINRLRRDFGFQGAPVRLIFSSRHSANKKNGL
ncbi:MAG: ribosome biogenesis GTPase Der [Nitrospinae bacterium]|nr:ribosome biogenesis GTPase Der [Nitrospinota bacterium]